MAAVQKSSSPLLSMLRASSAGGVVLMVCAAIALIWANSSLSQDYFALWDKSLPITIGLSHATISLQAAINDGLMAIFFLFVGLEIKRELLIGELASLRTAALPVIAAFGGMIVPALLFVAFNVANHSTRGWGIPMATDIAFALGVLALLGDRIPASLRVFLSALAIADDLGAVLVIALFYTATISWAALAVAEHMAEGEEAPLARRQQLLAGEFRRRMQVEPLPLPGRRGKLGGEAGDMRLVARRYLQCARIDLDEVEGAQL